VSNTQLAAELAVIMRRGLLADSEASDHSPKPRGTRSQRAGTLSGVVIQARFTSATFSRRTNYRDQLMTTTAINGTTRQARPRRPV
jgi:hypothetical protein